MHSKGAGMFLFPAERLILRIIVALLLIDAVMIVHKGLGVDLLGYAGSIGCGALLFARGRFIACIVAMNALHRH